MYATSWHGNIPGHKNTNLSSNHYQHGFFPNFSNCRIMCNLWNRSLSRQNLSAPLNITLCITQWYGNFKFNLSWGNQTKNGPFCCNAWGGGGLRRYFLIVIFTSHRAGWWEQVSFQHLKLNHQSNNAGGHCRTSLTGAKTNTLGLKNNLQNSRYHLINTPFS